MKKSVGIILLVFSLLLISLASAQVDLYLQDSLQLQLNVNGEFTLTSQSPDASIKSVGTEMFLFPMDTDRQRVILSSVTPQTGVIKFTWNNGKLGVRKFGYITDVATKNTRLKVKSKLPFPVGEIYGMKEFIQETATIDSSHPEIIAKATELAEGEDDLFKIVFKLASWVEENVNYDLNTLTETASQKASWVLRNKQGVCDEMTSLFIAMARSLGIPARFVKGISYSSSGLFNDPWQPHGWAEVYLPTIGWVSFDVTFGQYGYIDVTHIKLRDGPDPQDADTTYRWLGNNVNLQAKPLNLGVNVQKRGEPLPEEVKLNYELLHSEVKFGSYNLVKSTLTNNFNYYLATTLKLAVPREIEIIGRNKRTILLEPNEVRETFWVIKVSENLNENYIYTFPALIYTEKNITFRNEFTAQLDGPLYSRSEIEVLTVTDEEKSYSRQVSINCDGPEKLKLGEKSSVKCQIKNSGNTNLAEVQFCLEENCNLINLPINQIAEKTVNITAAIPGWNKALVIAENEFIEKKFSFNYVVLDQPKATIDFVAPETLTFNSNQQLLVKIGKESFSPLQKVVIKLNGPGITSNWQAQEIKQTEVITVNLQPIRLGFKNKFKVELQWQDENKNTYHEKKVIIIPGKSIKLIEKIKLIFNSGLNLL